MSILSNLLRTLQLPPGLPGMYPGVSQGGWDERAPIDPYRIDPQTGRSKVMDAILIRQAGAAMEDERRRQAAAQLGGVLVDNARQAQQQQTALTPPQVPTIGPFDPSGTQGDFTHGAGLLHGLAGGLKLMSRNMLTPDQRQDQDKLAYLNYQNNAAAKMAEYEAQVKNYEDRLAQLAEAAKQQREDSRYQQERADKLAEVRRKAPQLSPDASMMWNPETGAWEPSGLKGKAAQYGSIQAALVSDDPEVRARAMAALKDQRAFDMQMQSRRSAGAGGGNAGMQISPKDISVARSKMQTIMLARKQLANLEQAYQAGQGASLGPGGQGSVIGKITGKSSKFDASVDQMRQTITGLTRTPGIGSMSDYETRMMNAQFPSSSDREDVIQQKIQGLRMMLDTLSQGYGEMLGATDNTQPGKSASPSPKSQGGASSDPLGIR